MARPRSDLLRASPRAFRRWSLASVWALATIVLVGATVRLTGSGLGCSDWPRCEQDSVVPALEFHPMVEFVNRLYGVAVGLVVVATAIAAWRRAPRRRDLTILATALVPAVVANGVLGAVVVRLELAPVSVIGHFLLAMVALAIALVLHHRAGSEGGPGVPVVHGPARVLARVVLVGTTLAIVTGTVVTAAGPHGGDPEAERLAWPLPEVARVHGLTVVTLLLVVVVLVTVSARAPVPDRFRTWGRVLLAILVAQAALGWTQYLLGVPEALVLAHIAGAVGAFGATVALQLALDERPRRPERPDAIPPVRDTPAYA